MINVINQPVSWFHFKEQCCHFNMTYSSSLTENSPLDDKKNVKIPHDREVAVCVTPPQAVDCHSGSVDWAALMFLAGRGGPAAVERQTNFPTGDKSRLFSPPPPPPLSPPCRHEAGGCWTVRDCMVVYRNTSHVRCQCQRLGTFGVLMDSSHREVSDPPELI